MPLIGEAWQNYFRIANNPSARRSMSALTSCRRELKLPISRLFRQFGFTFPDSRLFISNHNYAVLNKQSPGSFLTNLLDLTSKDRAKFPVVFQKKACHYSCWKPKCGTPDERKAGRLARNAGADGPQNPRCSGATARLRHRPTH